MYRPICTFLSVVLAAASVAAAPITPSAQEQTALDSLSSRLPDARLLWVNEDRIFYMTIGDPSPKLISPAGATEGSPRWSPDGTRISFDRMPEGVFIMDTDFNNANLVIPGANTPSWTRNGAAITAIAGDGYRVLKYDLASGQTSTIYDSRDSPYNGQQVEQAAEMRRGGRFLLTFRTTPEHTTEIVDLQSQTYISNSMMERGDCSPAWAPDGSYIMTTARTSNRPVLKTDFDESGPSVGDSGHFIGVENTCDCSSFYIHGQRVSNDGNWVAFGAKIFDGPKSNGTREIWLWQIGETQESAVRVTFDTGEDQSPSLYIPSGEQPDAGSDTDGSAADAGGDDSVTDAGGDDSVADAGGDDSAADAGGDDSVTDASGDDSAVDAGSDSMVDAGDGTTDAAGDQESQAGDNTIVSGSCGCTQTASGGFLPFALLLLPGIGLVRLKRENES